MLEEGVKRGYARTYVARKLGLKKQSRNKTPWSESQIPIAHLPLWSAAVSLVHEAGIRSGVNMEMGSALHNAFQEAGLPAPRIRLEMEEA